MIFPYTHYYFSMQIFRVTFFHGGEQREFSNVKDLLWLNKHICAHGHSLTPYQIFERVFIFWIYSSIISLLQGSPIRCHGPNVKIAHQQWDIVMF